MIALDTETLPPEREPTGMRVDARVVMTLLDTLIWAHDKLRKLERMADAEKDFVRRNLHNIAQGCDVETNPRLVKCLEEMDVQEGA